jgi:CBS domain-containing protein
MSSSRTALASERHETARTVGEVMRAGIVPCARTASPAEVARIMDICDTDCVAVLSNGHGDDEHPIVWGLVTGHSLARVIAPASSHVTAEDLAATPVIRVRADLPIAQAEALLEAIGISHLLVIDPEHGAPLGVVSAELLARRRAPTWPGRRDRTPAAAS